jgi:hypothetical protein
MTRDLYSRRDVLSLALAVPLSLKGAAPLLQVKGAVPLFRDAGYKVVVEGATARVRRVVLFDAPVSDANPSTRSGRGARSGQPPK